MIDTDIRFPDHTKKDAVFLALLLKNHILWIDNLPELTGFQGAPQKKGRLIRRGFPIKVVRHAVPPKYKAPRPAFYSLDRKQVAELVGSEVVEEFIERVEKHWHFDARIEKGLQSKPQPLKTILAGKLMNGGDL